MNIVDSLVLIKKYSSCQECGSEMLGGTPSEGALIVEEETFTRSCKCGWSVVVDRRIKHIGTYTERKGSKLVGLAYEVSIYQHGHKLLPLLTLKEKTGVKRIDQHEKIEAWLNSKEGREWAMTVPAVIIS